MDNKLIIAFIIIFIIHRIIVGKAVNQILAFRGYFYDDWFIWGLLYGSVVIFVALSRPDNNANYIRQKKNSKVQISYPTTEWKCRKCKKLNPPYTGTCSCGNSREENDAPIRALQAKREAAASALANEKIKLDSELDNLLTLSAYKDLMDKGVITAADFEEKKKDLLPTTPETTK